VSDEPTLRRTLRFDPSQPVDPSLEWIATNGIGGYASGPVRGGLSRRFHGLLIASLPAPAGRMMCLNTVRLSVRVGGRTVVIAALPDEPLDGAETAVLREFWLDHGLPTWRYDCGQAVEVETRIVMEYGRNTTHLLVQIAGGGERPVVRLEPAFQVRPHEGLVSVPPTPPRRLHVSGPVAALDLAADLPLMHWVSTGETVETDLTATRTIPVDYALEAARGYDHTGALWAPGWIDIAATDRGEVAWTVTTEPVEDRRGPSPHDAWQIERTRRAQLLVSAGGSADPMVAELTLAADQFVVTPVGRVDEIARVRAAGDEPRSVIAGYHWFTDWGRDTMISLEGLTLMTGRFGEAGCILRTFAHYVSHGLIPNLFPEGAQRGLYHTADATLWFFHAIERYVRASGDQATLTALLPTLVEIAECHARGTWFGIGVDPSDGLLRQGADGYQLTWMDAKVGDWVVTPRRGKAVEINALWYNALRLLTHWLVATGHEAEAERWADLAAEASASFNRRFWNEQTECLFDVVDGPAGDDAACRPNQVLAISLDYPVLAPERWRAVLEVVRAQLLTPVGLRSLAPSDPNYKPTYDGDLRARDAAYHQGTVWAWLIGPFVDAWHRTFPEDQTGPREFLAGFVNEMEGSGIGTINEIFDAEPPYTPRGCIAQAWSVAEVLRAWRSLDRTPGPEPARQV
jgi:predicted glycogen debranching enzyme